MSDFNPEEIDAPFVRPERYPGLQTLAPPLWRVWQFPTFQTRAGWSVHRPRDQSSVYWVRRITWGAAPERPEQLHHFAADVRVSTRTVDELSAALRSIQAPVWTVVDGCGLDGVTRGVGAGNLMARTQISWWGAAPDELRGLADWHTRTIEALERALPGWSARPWTRPA